MSQSIRLADSLASSQIYGPGHRFVIWVQGCSLECPGCWNREFWSVSAGYNADVDDLLSEILATDHIEGVTILGGEPLEQPEPVLELIQSAKASGLTVMLYTGYEEHELNELQLECVNSSDIVIMGRYVASLRDTGLRWRGSSNQEIRMISDAYENMEIHEQEEVEITIDSRGQVSMAGYPQGWLLRALEEL